jgi:hypothetical protein
LREVNDEAGRRLIRKLLLEEEQKEVPFHTPSPPTGAHRSTRAASFAVLPGGIFPVQAPTKFELVINR